MFLSILDENEKKCFLELALKAAEANNEVVKEELDMLAAFANEMKIPPITKCEKSLEEVTKYLVDNSSNQTRKIVIFELIGILYADSTIDNEELEFFNKVCILLEINDDLKNEMIGLVTNYADLYKKICEVVISK